MRKEIEILGEISVKLDRLISLVVAVNREQIATLLRDEVDTKDKRLVFDLLDGKNSVREIAEKTGVNISSISRWSQRWEEAGLISSTTQSDIQGRREKLVSPSAFDL